MTRFAGSSSSPAMRLMTAWIIWGALLVGQLAFLFVIVFVIWPQQHAQQAQRQSSLAQGEGDFMRILFYCAIGMLVGCVLMGYVIRRIVYGRRLENGLIDPAKFVTGNIIFWAMCEASGMFGLVVMLLAGHAWPYVIVPVVALIVQIVNFPKGDEIRVTP